MDVEEIGMLRWMYSPIKMNEVIKENIKQQVELGHQLRMNWMPYQVLSMNTQNFVYDGYEMHSRDVLQAYEFDCDYQEAIHISKLANLIQIHIYPQKTQKSHPV